MPTPDGLISWSLLRATFFWAARLETERPGAEWFWDTRQPAFDSALGCDGERYASVVRAKTVFTPLYPPIFIYLSLFSLYSVVVFVSPTVFYFVPIYFFFFLFPYEFRARPFVDPVLMARVWLKNNFSFFSLRTEPYTTSYRYRCLNTSSDVRR